MFKAIKSKITFKVQIAFCVLLVFMGLLIASWNYLLEKKNQVYDTMYYELASLPSYVETDDDAFRFDEYGNTVSEGGLTKPSKPSSSNNVNSMEGYLGRLVIPKINFNRNFYSLGSYNNNVNRNIAVMKGSSTPDIVGGNLIIAGHSGNVWYSFFGSLYKVKNGDLAYVYYNDVKYTYKIVDSYTVKKNGTVTIKRDRRKNTLTLITCTRNSKTKQTVYIAEQIASEA